MNTNSILVCESLLISVFQTSDQSLSRNGKFKRTEFKMQKKNYLEYDDFNFDILGKPAYFAPIMMQKLK